MPLVEECLEVSPVVINSLQPKLRADIVYFETPNNGAVFSSGAITRRGSLAHNGYDNNVSRITENVLRKFMA
jgi:N,N-dimethylformamidase